MDNESHSEESLSPQQLKDRYRRARDPVLRAHLHIIWQLSLGKPLSEVSELAGYSTKWVKEISRRYEERGVEGLGDRRHTNPGAAKRALLSKKQQRELKQALLEPPPEGGCGAL
jgi:transposase